MRRVVALPRSGGGWRFRIVDPAELAQTDIGFDEFAAESHMNRVVSETVAGIGDPLWRLEIAKHVGVHLAGTLAAADALEAAMAKADTPSSVLTKKPDELVHALRLRRGRPLARFAARAAACARMAGAIPLAVASLAVSVPRFSAGAAPARAEAVIAMHGELSNRTRHLLPPAFDAGDSPAICVIGRPMASLDAIRHMFDPDGRKPGMRLFRPWSMADLLASLPSSMARMAAGLGVAASTSARLPFREWLGICYRIGLGAASARWWRHSGLRPGLVLFGHTGVADSSQLEAAMQRAGSRTIHCVHGGSLGWNFAASSDIGVFLNGHDARLAARFPAYGRTLHIPKEKPAYAPGDPGRWLLLTAYSHIMNPAWAHAGIEPDLAAIRHVAALAREHRPAQMIWRPHPAIARLPERQREELQAAARAAGFEPWPEGMAYEEMAAFGRIFSTPSTAALDALILGKAAELVVTAPLVTETIYGMWPQRGKGGEEFFERIWEAMEPGRFLASVEEARGVTLT